MILTQKSDLFGAAASSLCLIHCLATPFIFVAQSCSASCCTDSPIWWSAIDYMFLVISFLAIYWSVRTTSSQAIKYGLWGSWLLLLAVLLNEKMDWIHLSYGTNYLPAIALISLHLYNKKYCQCAGEECCAVKVYSNK
ncbi:MAG: MerC domain-containing protein [Aureispira sp.]|nr:MerC domain-containing protein [Aureispira sp.]